MQVIKWWMHLLVLCMRINQKGILENIWRIDLEIDKRNIRTTIQLIKEDLNSKLSWNFGTNDRMLQYKKIKSFFFTNIFFVTKKAAGSRGYTYMHIYFLIKDMSMLLQWGVLVNSPKLWRCLLWKLDSQKLKYLVIISVTNKKKWDNSVKGLEKLFAY